MSDKNVSVQVGGRSLARRRKKEKPLIARALRLCSVLLLVPTLAHPAVLENPGSGGSYSGIGVVSGWKCEAAGALTVVFNDDGQHIPLLYGSERTDVRDAGACRGAHVGFVALWNWGNLGEGTHTAVAYDNGQAFARSTFSVATLGEAFVVGARGECTIEDFPSTGETATFAWNQNTQHLELVPGEIPSGFAPADQATFDRLAVGKRVVSVDDPRYAIDFLEARRFVGYEPGARGQGSYRYSKTGPNTGTLTQHYDDGNVCTGQLTFTSATTGRTRYTCYDGDREEGDWRLIDSPSSGGGGAVQNDGQCRAGLVVHPGAQCTHPTTGGTFSVDSSGRGSFTVGGFTSSSGRSIQMRNTTINGQTLTFVAQRAANGNSWTIEAVE